MENKVILEENEELEINAINDIIQAINKLEINDNNLQNNSNEKDKVGGKKVVNYNHDDLNQISSNDELSKEKENDSNNLEIDEDEIGSIE